MRVTAAEYLEQFIQSTTPQTQFVAFLRSYDEPTRTAKVTSAMGSSVLIDVDVAPLIATLPGSLQPNARVLVRRVGAHKPLICDVLSPPR